MQERVDARRHKPRSHPRHRDLIELRVDEAAQVKADLAVARDGARRRELLDLALGADARVSEVFVETPRKLLVHAIPPDRTSRTNPAALGPT